VAENYNNLLKGTLKTPVVKKNRSSTWAQYTIRVEKRDLLQAKLKKYKIPTAIFYPLPLHLQECFKYLNYKEQDFHIAEQASKEVISLPMNPFLTNEQVEYIANTIKELL